MHHFIRPLKITGVAVLLALVLGIAAGTWIYWSDTSGRMKTRRAQQLGKGVGVMTVIVVAPFWLMAADKVGKERRLAKRDKESE